MKWFENNPVGVVLAALCGGLLLISAILVFVWSRPVSSGAEPPEPGLSGSGSAVELVSDIGPISAYRVVTDRPVFNESRRPSVSVEGDGLDLEEMASAVAGAPEVKLTGVVITPSYRMATLKPLGNGESVIAHEGVPLEGEYVGWVVSDIEPRRVVLASLDGESMELDLQVNTRRIEEPPEPEPQTAQQAAGQDEQQALDEEDDEPMTRAEEIRQRIAERREELRREQEQNTRDDEAERKARYQSAIRNMINSGGKKDEDDDGDR